MRVEYMTVMDDRSWDTVVVQVPDFLTDPSHPNIEVLNHWANDHLGRQAQYRRVEFFVVYSAPATTDDATKYDLLEVDEGDECPLCQCGTVGHEIRGNNRDVVAVAVCRGECGESVELPEFICPSCKTIYSSASMGARRSIEEHGRCRPCQDTFEKDRHYKVWLTVEEICEELDHYGDVDVDWGGTGDFRSIRDSVRFARRLHHIGKEILDLIPPSMQHNDPKASLEKGKACWDLVSDMLEDPHLRTNLQVHAPYVLKRALRIFEEDEA